MNKSGVQTELKHSNDVEITKATFLVDGEKWRLFQIATKRDNSDASKTLRRFINDYLELNPVEVRQCH